MLGWMSAFAVVKGTFSHFLFDFADVAERFSFFSHQSKIEHRILNSEITVAYIFSDFNHNTISNNDTLLSMVLFYISVNKSSEKKPTMNVSFQALCVYPKPDILFLCSLTEYTILWPQYSLEHQMWFNPLQKIVPNKCTISSCLIELLSLVSL